MEGTGTITLHSKLDGDVQNEDSNYEEHFWEERAIETQETLGFVTTKTIPNNFEIERFTVTAACAISSMEPLLCLHIHNSPWL